MKHHDDDELGASLAAIRRHIAAMKRRAKNVVLVETHKVGYYGHYNVIVPDHAAGSSNPRFTVYRIPASPSRRTKVIGRELPLGLARRIATKSK